MAGRRSSEVPVSRSMGTGLEGNESTLGLLILVILLLRVRPVTLIHIEEVGKLLLTSGSDAFSIVIVTTSPPELAPFRVTESS